MRNLLIATVALALYFSGFIVGEPYYDLRYPVYFITTESFFSGCDKDEKGQQACRHSRVQAVKDGVNQWRQQFTFADESFMQPIIVDSEDDLPPDRFNREPIYLRIERGFCHGRDVACYCTGPFSEPEMVFRGAYTLDSRLVAHEFGHTLGRDDNDVPKDTESIMSYAHQIGVSRLDVKLMCQLHEEEECRGLQ